MKLIIILLCVLLSVSGSQAAALVIGGFSTARAGASSIVETQFAEELRTSLLAAFPGSSFVGMDTLTAQALSAVDLVIVGAPTVAAPAMTLSSAEQTALLNFIKAGHGALIFADNTDFAGGPNESFLDPFGFHVTGKVQGDAPATSVAPAHPVMNGPFGVVTTFATSFGGFFDVLDPSATALANYDINGQPALAAIAPGTLSPTSRGVVFIADADPLLDSADGGNFGNGDNETFLRNAVFYTTVPEPASGAFLVVAGLCLTRRPQRRK